ncbi:MAG: DUF3137 domain-containing protein, partial [Planctomycetales bacterium]
KHSVDYTQVHVRWRDPNFRCEVYPMGFFQRMGKFLGMQDIEIGSPRFDEEYIITGNDVSQLRRALNPQSQSHIHAIRNLFNTDEIYVQITGGEFLVKKRGLLKNFPDLEQFTAIALQLYDAASEVSTEGITFVEGSDRRESFRELVGPVCQICGEEIHGNAAVCRSCKTPHHRDCWQYYGACSIYGCGGRKFTSRRARE